MGCISTKRQQRQQNRISLFNRFKNIQTSEDGFSILNELREGSNDSSELDFLIFEAVNTMSVVLLDCLKTYYTQHFTLQKFKNCFKLQNAYGNTPIHISAIHGSIPCIEFLLENGDNLYKNNNDGISPFIILKKKDIYIEE